MVHKALDAKTLSALADEDRSADDTQIIRAPWYTNPALLYVLLAALGASVVLNIILAAT